MTNRCELYRLALDRWGERAQKTMVVEELGELLVALARWERGRADVRDVAEEVADVLIMCGQLRELLGPGLVDYLLGAKLERLEARLVGGQLGEGPK